jgi:hypothetical protein
VSQPPVADLLGAWERAVAAPPHVRDLILLALALPDRTVEELAGLTVGQRDAHLLGLRERNFGPLVVAQDSCPGCGDTVELEFATGDIRVPDQFGDPPPHTVAHGDFTVSVRPPTVEEVLASRHADDLEATREALLEHAVVDARRAGVPLTAAELPGDVVALVDAELSAMDPQGDVSLALVCPECGQAWQTQFDVGGFLWTELDAWACRLLREVHVLASAYCWSEADVLTLSPVRRRFYLQAVGA